jgi:euchromatic histone-lysine N-methyltransferase
VRSGDMAFFPVRAAPSHGVEEGVLLQDVLDKVVAAKRRAPAADWYRDGPNAMVAKESQDSVGSASFLEINGAECFSGARRDQPGKNHLESLAVQGQELEEGEIAADTLDSLEDMANQDFEGHKLGERRMAVQPHLVTLGKPCSSTSAATIHLSSAPALATNKEKSKFEYVFVAKDKLNHKSVVYLDDDDDTLMAVASNQGKLQLCRSIRRQGTYGGANDDVRCVRVKMICKRFEFLCRFLDQAQGSINLLRVDLAAYKVIKNLPDFIKYRSMVGEVDGVEVGDEFVFRVELAIVGLHTPLQAGIDTTKDTDGEPIAVSIVASGGYLDEYCSSSGELIYIGSGGKAAGTDQDGDQKLEHANLALKNCIDRGVPVRVTHGIRTEEVSHSTVKEFPKFIYDGLYHVVAFCPDGMPGSRVFKYKLRRDAGQPQLPLSVTEWLLKSVVHHR